MSPCCSWPFSPRRRHRPPASTFEDNFESYADTAALCCLAERCWHGRLDVSERGPAGSADTSKMIHHVNRNARRDRTFRERFPVRRGRWWSSTSCTTPRRPPTRRPTITTRYSPLTAGHADQLISIGKTNLATTNGLNNVNKYQGRVAFPPLAEGGANWINLNANRSVGWHTFKVEIFPTIVNFYVDGVLDTAGVPYGGHRRSVFRSSYRIGPAPLAAVAYYDNFRVLSPDPGDINLDGSVDRLGRVRVRAAFWRYQRDDMDYRRLRRRSCDDAGRPGAASSEPRSECQPVRIVNRRARAVDARAGGIRICFRAPASSPP